MEYLNQIKHKLLESANIITDEYHKKALVENTNYGKIKEERKFELSICTMYYEKDQHHLQDFLTHLPPNIELILVYTEQNCEYQGIKEYNETLLQKNIFVKNFKYCYSELNFSQMKNEIKEYATGDWILFLDVDERLCHHNNKFLLNKLSADVGGLLVAIYSYMYSHPLKNELGKVCRIYRNNKNFKYKYRVHEEIEESIIKENYHIIFSNILIQHYGYEQSIKGLIEKHKRNLLLNCKDLIDLPENIKIIQRIFTDIRKLYDYNVFPIENFDLKTFLDEPIDNSINYSKKFEEINKKLYEHNKELITNINNTTFLANLFIDICHIYKYSQNAKLQESIKSFK
jgi:hypothetical protein